MCRICSSAVERSYCVSLFSSEMTQCNLASRMSKLIPISHEDPVLHYACRSCKGKFISMETKLESLHTLAKSSYKALASFCLEQQPSTNKKHTKDTSGNDASPSTVKALLQSCFANSKWNRWASPNPTSKVAGRRRMCPIKENQLEIIDQTTTPHVQHDCCQSSHTSTQSWSIYPHQGFIQKKNFGGEAASLANCGLAATYD